MQLHEKKLLSIHDKLDKHSFTIELQKIEGREIDLSDLTKIIDNKIQTKSFAPKTLETYAQTFLGWLDFSGLSIPNLSAKMMRRAKNALSYTPQMYPSDVEVFISTIDDKYSLSKTTREQKLLYDTKSMGLLTYSKGTVLLTDAGKEAQEKNHLERRLVIAKCAKKMDKIRVAYDACCASPNVKSRNFKDHISGILDGLNSQIYINKTARSLYLWANYIIEAENEYNKTMHATSA